MRLVVSVCLRGMLDTDLDHLADERDSLVERKVLGHLHGLQDAPVENKMGGETVQMDVYRFMLPVQLADAIFGAVGITYYNAPGALLECPWRGERRAWYETLHVVAGRAVVGMLQAAK